jgi:hypothetical protein
MHETQPNYLEPIKKALAPEDAMAFMEHVNRKGLKPWDSDLELAAEVAERALSIREFQKWFDGSTERLELLVSGAASKFDNAIAMSITRCTDELQTDLRFAARECATSEFRAASAMRDEAIEREVQRLTAATQRYVEAEQRAKARETATGAPAKIVASGTAAWFNPKVAAAIAIALIAGLLIGLNLPNRNHRRVSATMPSQSRSVAAHHSEARPSRADVTNVFGLSSFRADA